MDRVIRFMLILTGIYLLVDGLVHVIDIRVVDIVGNWPEYAVSYAKFMNHIYGSFVLFTALLCFVVQKDIHKYRLLLQITAFWAFAHGLLLIFTSSTNNFTVLFRDYPSLYMWMPFYNYYLYFEASLSILVSLLIFIWTKSKRKT